MSQRTRIAIGALCWIVGAQWFITQFVVQASWRTPYSLAHNYISDLGAVNCRTERGLGYVCSPLHTVMDVSYVIFGICTIAGVVLLWVLWPRRRLVVVGLVLLVLLGLGKVVIGLAPEDQRLFLHTLGSLGILIGNVGALLLGFGLRRYSRWMATIFLAVGIVGILAFCLDLLPRLDPIRGALERVSDWPLPLWLIVLGVLILFGRARAPRDARQPTDSSHSTGAVGRMHS